MRRTKIAGCVGLMLLAESSLGFISPVFAAPDSPADLQGPVTDAATKTDPKISELISRLSDPSPRARLDAVQRLINQGEAARPTLRRALATATPEARCEMDRVLLHIPWIQAGDSDAVEQAFTGYADLDAESRCARIDGWMAPLQTAAGPALLRVVLNDPSPAVRWEAADALRMNFDDNPVLVNRVTGLIEGRLKSDEFYLPAKQNAPLLAAAGWALRQKSPKRATELLNQAIAMEAAEPAAFRGQLDFAFLWLVDRANLTRDHDLAIKLLREQANRTPWNEDRVPDSIASLFAAQADFGPSEKFTTDLQSYREYFVHPELVYALGRLVHNQGYANAGDAIDAIAFLMSGNSADSHYLAGSFLATHNWNKAAERELKWALTLSDGKSVNIYFQLAALADERDDDLASARYTEAGLLKLTDSHGLVQTNRYGQISSWSPDEAWAEVHWHYLRVCRDSNDAAGVKVHLDKLLTMDQEQQIFRKVPGMAADVVPALQAAGDDERANDLFETAYGLLKQKVSDAPEEPMPKNNLAWLCACSGKKLDDALRLSTAAVTEDPDNAACLDTQAETYMRLGNPAKALEIELHAKNLKPDDVYMDKQITRFRAALGDQKKH